MDTQRRPFDEIKKDLEDAIAWIEEQREKVFNLTSRVRRYLRDVQEIESQWKIDGAQSLINAKSLPALLNSMTQGDTIGLVVKSLRDLRIVDNELLEKIFDSLQGPEHTKDETTSSNKARNLFFELRILSRCLSAGLPAESGLHPDVKTEIDGAPVHIECKRAFAPSNIKKLISSARNQLRKQIAEQPDVIGVIALDLTRLVATNSPYVELADSRSWPDACARTNAMIRTRHEGDVKRALAGKVIKGIQGLMYFYDRATFNRSDHIFGTGHSIDFVPLTQDVILGSILHKFYEIMRENWPPKR